jgi:hypothetical protein
MAQNQEKLLKGTQTLPNKHHGRINTMKTAVPLLEPAAGQLLAGASYLYEFIRFL